MMKNRDIAAKLNKVADMLEIQDVQWKPRAYRTAARRIENMSESLQDIYEKRGKKGLSEIPSVGERLAEHIADYMENGTVYEWENVIKSTGTGLQELSNIEGLGPKNVKRLSKELGIKGMEDLKRAAEQGRIRELPGMGEKTEKNILQGIRHYEAGKERMLIDKAMAVALETIAYLRGNARLQRIDYAGSLRRMKDTIGDIDILTVTDEPSALMDAFTGMPGVSRVLVKGKTKTSVLFEDGVQVDVRAIVKESYGAAMQYFTGSKDHNIALRNLAMGKGYKLSEYGLYEKESGRLLSGENEEDVYSKLGLQWIPPELRENTGEVEAAQENQLPHLVTLKDVRGDLHVHSAYSDGLETIQRIARKAKQLGYDYLAITDHSRSQRVAGGMAVETLKRQWKEIDKVSKKEGIAILKGAEVDIMGDGSLDYDDDILEQLDIVIASVHSGFRSKSSEMTERIIKAVRHPKVDVLGHPTGRLVSRRQGYDADFHRIFRECAKNNVALEINCSPERLDLNNVWIVAAREYDVRFCLGTDAHDTGMLENMMFGVGQARRAWLVKEDLINCKGHDRLMRSLG